jgi:SAM-dependent methyltransferase
MWYVFLAIIILIILTMAIAGKSLAPWVPSWSKDLPRIFELANIRPGQVFYDLGCGNGKTVLYANKKFQAKAIGLEIALPLYFVCKIRQVFNWDKRLIFKYKNLFKEDLSQADVIFIFGMPKTIKDKLKSKLEKELKAGAKVISYVFAVNGWEPVMISKDNNDQIPIYLYQR